jgi:hypothetical protein
MGNTASNPQAAKPATGQAPNAAPAQTTPSTPTGTGAKAINSPLVTPVSPSMTPYVKPGTLTPTMGSTPMMGSAPSQIKSMK